MKSAIEMMPAKCGLAAMAAVGLPLADLHAVARGPGRLHVELLRSDEQLAALAEEWNRLAGAMPFRRWDWIEAWWRHYRTAETELFVPIVRSEARRLIGLAPWYLTTGCGRGRVIHFLGDGEVCSEYPTVLAESGAETQVAAALAAWLCEDAKRRWDLIELTAVDAADPMTNALAAQFAAHGHRVHQRQGMNCWSVELPTTWEKFLATLSGSRRGQVRQLVRKHFEQGAAKVRLLKNPAELESQFAMLVDLHQRRRRQLDQPGCFASPRFAAFHQEVSRRMLRNGQLRLVSTELAGRPIAVDYSFTSGDTVYYYQTGIEPEAESVSPGWLGMIGTLRLAIEQGYRRFDFLRGDEPYKASWGATPRPLHDLRIVAQRPTAQLRHAVWLAANEFARVGEGES